MISSVRRHAQASTATTTTTATTNTTSTSSEKQPVSKTAKTAVSAGEIEFRPLLLNKKNKHVGGGGGVGIQIRRRDKLDVSAKGGFRVQIPKRMLAYAAIVFVLLPILLFFYILIVQIFGKQRRVGGSRHMKHHHHEKEPSVTYFHFENKEEGGDGKETDHNELNPSKSEGDNHQQQEPNADISSSQERKDNGQIEGDLVQSQPFENGAVKNSTVSVGLRGAGTHENVEGVDENVGGDDGGGDDEKTQPKVDSRVDGVGKINRAETNQGNRSERAPQATNEERVEDDAKINSER